MSIGIEEEDKCFFEGELAHKRDLETGTKTPNPYNQESDHLRYEHWFAGYCNVADMHHNDFEVLCTPRKVIDLDNSEIN